MQVAILMYHYVRDFSLPGAPALKGLDVRNFERQIDLVGSVCRFVSIDDVIEAWSGGKPLPDRAVLLSFDDGYSDHFHYAFPVLRKRGIRGAFYPTAETVLDGKVLDINKIHFLLAAHPDPEPLISHIRSYLTAAGPSSGLPSFDEIWNEIAHDGKFDPANIIFLKGCLQYALPEEVRRELGQELFLRYSEVSETDLASELYLSREMMREMHEAGMHFGNHSVTHKWLSFLSQKELEEEVDGGLEMLDAVGVNSDRWTMCYPFEGPTEEARERITDCLRSRGCALALSAETEVADSSKHDRLLMPRLDTSDVPREPDAVTRMFHA